MDETQFWLVLAEMKESNKLMKAMVSELSQIKFELVNERMKRDADLQHQIKTMQNAMFRQGIYILPCIDDPYLIKISTREPEPEPDKEHALDVMK